jgi:hypothetical protein
MIQACFSSGHVGAINGRVYSIGFSGATELSLDRDIQILNPTVVVFMDGSVLLVVLKVLATVV